MKSRRQSAAKLTEKRLNCKERPMAKRESVTKDEHYDLVSVLYHALQGDDTLAQYIEDAEGAGDEDLADHFRDIREKYREIAQEAKDLLREKLVSGTEDEEQEDEEDT
jgi:hypothetical protein